LNNISENLAQIELASLNVSAPMLRLLIGRAVDVIESAPGASTEYGQFLLLKLHHLLSHQQVPAAARNGTCESYLAPNLVIQDPFRWAA